MSKLSVLLIRNDFYSKSKQYFSKHADIVGINLTCVRWNELNIEIYKNSPIKITFGEHGVDKFDVLFITTLGGNYYEYTQLTAYLRENNIPLVDRSLLTPGRLSDNKFHQLMKVKFSEVPVPHSTLVNKQNIVSYLNEKQNFPVMLKATDFNRGKGVYLISDLKKAKTAINKNIDGKSTRNFIIQEVIDYDKDFRIVIIGDKILGAIERKGAPNEIRANIYQGGTATYIKDIDPLLDKLTRKAANALSLEIAGIDFLQDKKGNYFFLEANRSFGYEGFEKVSGISVMEEIFSYIKNKYSVR